MKKKSFESWKYSLCYWHYIFWSDALAQQDFSNKINVEFWLEKDKKWSWNAIMRENWLVMIYRPMDFPPYREVGGTSVAIARENGQVWLWTSYFSHFKIRFRFRFFLRLPEICCQSKLQPIAFIVPAFNAVIFSNLNLLTGTFNLTIPSPACNWRNVIVNLIDEKSLIVVKRIRT